MSGLNRFEAREVEIRLSLHEEICAERYQKLYAMLEENRKELKELRQIASMGSGAWKAVLGLGIVLSVILTTLKITFFTTFRE